ncbi:MAG: pantoate--beta-alanine ligase [Candidatus Cloacimonetes bacterium]|mgnify:CR=1 FL=1|jgi:pantoate--beta-alanine ligase|nr:pantoate--beta-alanine ligase [Candidatus Cloacimonadota bacterium]MDD2423113.1 pantoate--beta-alanine ligase [Candidatus Cloacimonadota bacterium]MDD3563637.1 pantoate--beta-alanine ligase [Candidatus Cloacimonadota bacterium]MDD4276471.1 pantoate--beta-alanine ligase [Candidatus Cloacimonadota bacterium]MDY0325462.1 pantoate--beta-alanine ligase [Candidatus Cloacimonadaceae bacterium]
MQILCSIPEMQAVNYPAGSKVGFVPTMGYLHEGHLSLVDAAVKSSDLVVVSIFVNPAQFAPSEDLDSYPRDFDRDLALLEKRKVDYVFFPTADEMYPPGYKTWVEVEGISHILCGNTRPEHFKGVSTVVLKLLNIVRPQSMYMGEKDFQQLTVLQRMTQDLNLGVDIIGCPIIREEDGLAKSSRNLYLKGKEREQATCLYKALTNSQKLVAAGELAAEKIIAAAEQLILDSLVKVDYIKIVDGRDLSEVQDIDEHSRMLIAAWVGKPRLIDNMSLKA